MMRSGKGSGVGPRKSIAFEYNEGRNRYEHIRGDNNNEFMQRVRPSCAYMPMLNF